MSDTTPWITLVLLGLYHGINPGMGWLFAVALGLQERSRRAVLRAFAPLAIGHAVSIGVFLAAVAVVQAVLPLQGIRWIGGLGLVAFGLYKLLVPMSCPRWVGMRVGSWQLGLWSFLMATGHGAGLMLLPVVLDRPEPPALPQGAIPTGVERRTGGAVPPAGHVPFRVAVRDDGKETRIRASGLDHRVAGSVTISTTEPTSKGWVRTATTRSFPAAPQPEDKPCCRKPGGEPAARPGEEPVEPACHAALRQAAGPGSGAGAVAAVLLHTLAMLAAMATAALLVYDRLGLRILRTGWFNLDLLWAGALIAGGVWTLIG